MQISIITVCYNSASTIRDTFESVLCQTYSDIDYIIVDGNSKDETISIIKEYEQIFNGKMHWISEPDNGIYDAMNKGIQMASGGIIGILNSDDYYISNNVLALVMQTMSENNIDSCYGNLLYLKNDKSYRYWRSGLKKPFKSGWMPPHPSFFVKKNIYEKYGLFRLDCGINADYELMLRLLEVHNISTKWLDYVIVCMNVGGKSNKNFQSRIDAVIDNKKAWYVNNIKPSMFTFYCKRFRKIPQYLTAIFYRYKKKEYKEHSK
jgi:glycosyltransferase involved in cell wall biosynthesis